MRALYITYSLEFESAKCSFPRSHFSLQNQPFLTRFFVDVFLFFLLVVLAVFIHIAVKDESTVFFKVASARAHNVQELFRHFTAWTSHLAAAEIDLVCQVVLVSVFSAFFLKKEILESLFSEAVSYGVEGDFDRFFIDVDFAVLIQVAKDEEFSVDIFVHARRSQKIISVIWKKGLK